jgi:hypothetical protein
MTGFDLRDAEDGETSSNAYERWPFRLPRCPCDGTAADQTARSSHFAAGLPVPARTVHPAALNMWASARDGFTRWLLALVASGSSAACAGPRSTPVTVDIGKVAAPPGAGTASTATPSVLPEPAEDGSRTIDLAESKFAFQRYGCNACHSTDGSARVGPTLLGVFGSRVELANGTFVRVDRPYVIESIRNPASAVVKGFPNQMPAYMGPGHISEQGLLLVVDYVEWLGTPEATGAPP